MKVSMSIHLRRYLGGPKKNTCKSKSLGTLLRLETSLKEHLSRHPRDGMSQARLVKVSKRIAEF